MILAQNKHDIATKIIDLTCTYFGKDKEDILHKYKEIKIKRFLAKLLRMHGLSYNDICNTIGLKTHSTVIGYIRVNNAYIQLYPDYREEYLSYLKFIDSQCITRLHNEADYFMLLDNNKSNIQKAIDCYHLSLEQTARYIGMIAYYVDEGCDKRDMLIRLNQLMTFIEFEKSEKAL